MKSNKEIEIGFTDLLYAAVISFAIAEIKDLSIFTINSSNIMLFFSFLIIFDDWLLYHLELKDISGSNKTYMVMYVLDILVIMIWHLLVVLPKGDAFLFILILIIFLVVASIWEIMFDVKSPTDVLKKTDLPLGIAYCVLLIVYINSPSAIVPLLIIAIMVFVASRICLDWIPWLRK